MCEFLAVDRGVRSLGTAPVRLRNPVARDGCALEIIVQRYGVRVEPDDVEAEGYALECKVGFFFNLD